MKINRIIYIIIPAAALMFVLLVALTGCTGPMVGQKMEVTPLPYVIQIPVVPDDGLPDYVHCPSGPIFPINSYCAVHWPSNDKI